MTAQRLREIERRIRATAPLWESGPDVAGLAAAWSTPSPTLYEFRAWLD